MLPFEPAAVMFMLNSKNSNAFTVYKKAIHIFIVWTEFTKWNRFVFWFCTLLNKSHTLTFIIIIIIQCISMIDNWYLSHKKGAMYESLCLCLHLVNLWHGAKLGATNLLFFISLLLAVILWFLLFINFFICYVRLKYTTHLWNWKQCW